MVIGKNRGVAGDVQGYSFSELSDTMNKNSGNIRPFVLKDLGKKNSVEEISPQAIRTERQSAKTTNFQIDDVVKRDRGLIKQEEEDYEKRVAAEVEKRISIIKEEAIQSGYSQGEEKGYKDAYSKAIMDYDDRINKLTAMIDEVVSKKDELFKSHRDDMHNLIKTISKWVILREIKNDSYLTQLLEKLVLELHTKQDLLIKVNEECFGEMNDVLALVQKKLGAFPNVRVEVGREMEHPGIIVESRNGIIDGSLESQFANIDKLFDEIGISSGNSN